MNEELVSQVDKRNGVYVGNGKGTWALIPTIMITTELGVAEALRLSRLSAKGIDTIVIPETELTMIMALIEKYVEANTDALSPQPGKE